MNKEFLTPDGWLNPAAIEKACPQAAFFVLLGARQVGKTYNILDYFHRQQLRYIFMRMSADELKFSMSPKANQYEAKGFPWAEDMRIEGTGPSLIYDDKFEDGALPVAMAISLSAVAKIRGFGADGYDAIFFDEFIPENQAYTVPDAGTALINAYITINGQREKEGRPPVKMWLAANSNNLASDILKQFSMTNIIHTMKRKGQTFYYNPQRRLCIILVDDSPASEALAKSALFQCIGTDSAVADMAISNDFAYDDFTGIRSMPLKEYRNVCAIDGLTIYQHKSLDIWYIVERGECSRRTFTSSNPNSFKAFKSWWRMCGNQWLIDGVNIYYNTFTAKTQFNALIK